MTLRVLMVTRRFWPLVGGAEMVMANLASAMRGLGAETTILTAQWEKDWPREVVHREVPVIRLAQPRQRGWGTYRYMRGLSRWLHGHRGQYDAVCVSMLRHSAHVAVKRLAPGTAVLLRAEGGGLGGDIQWQRTGRFGSRIRRSCRQATVVAPSQQIVDELQQAGYPRTEYVPNGVEIPPAASDRNAARLALAEANYDLLALGDAPVAVYTGRLDRRKGLLDLVRAWPKILQRRPEARLWLVGEGKDRGELFQLIKDSDLRGRVLLPGAFDNVDELLQAANLFVLPSHEEGMSLALLEAMAAGLPVVASDIPGNRTLVEHQRNGLLVPPNSPRELAQAIEQLIDSPALGVQLGRAGRQLVERRYSLDHCARRHLQLLEQIATHAAPMEPAS